MLLGEQRRLSQETAVTPKRHQYVAAVSERACEDPPDKKSGVRFQLAKDEEAALRPLTRRITNGTTPLPIAVAFDCVASALLDRRLGYSCEWERLSQRTSGEWDSCLDAGLRRLRW